MNPSEKRRIVLTPRQKQGMVRSFLMLAPFVATMLFLAVEGQRLLADRDGGLAQTLYQLALVCRRYGILLTLAIWIGLMPIRYGLVNDWPRAPRLFKLVVAFGCLLLLAVVGMVYLLAVVGP